MSEHNEFSQEEEPTDSDNHQALVARLKADHPTLGYRKLAELSGGLVDRHQVRRALDRLKIAGAVPAAIEVGGGPLALYETARRALAEARRVDEVLQVRDHSKWLDLYARQAKDFEMLANATELRARAERRLGEMLALAKASGQIAEGRPRKNGSEPRPFSRVTLEEAGIDKTLSSRAQKSASISERAFEAAVAGMRERIAAGHATVVINPAADAAKAEKQQSRRATYDAEVANGLTVDDLHALARTGFKAGAILADPPWKFLARSPLGEGRSASVHYNTEEIEKICALPIRELAADDCALVLWTLDWDPEYVMARKLIAAWGFEHKTTAFTWAKTNPSGEGFFMGNGYWTRANPETSWLCTRGNPIRRDAGVRQLIISPVREHSEKPDEIHGLIERLVDGPYLELFGRKPVQNWRVWGDQIPRESWGNEAPVQTEAAE